MSSFAIFFLPWVLYGLITPLPTVITHTFSLHLLSVNSQLHKLHCSNLAGISIAAFAKSDDADEHDWPV